MNAIRNANLFKPLFIGLALSAVAVAQAPDRQPGPPPAGAPCHGPRHPFFDLKLTDAQKASLKSIAEQHRAALETLRKASREADQAFQKALQDPATKDADLKALHDKLSQSRFAELLEQRAMQREREAVLTAEQKALLKKAPRMPEPRPGGHPGGPQPGAFHPEGPRPEAPGEYDLGGPEGPGDFGEGIPEAHH